MRNVKLVILFLLIQAIFCCAAFAQWGLVDVVYLKNGGMIKGIIIEQIPNESIKIQTKDGNIFVYRNDEIEKIAKEKEVAEPQKTSRQGSEVIKTTIPQTPRFYVNIGMGIPSSPNDFSDYWKTGLNIGVGIGYPVSKNLDIIAMFNYSRFSFDGEKFITDAGYGGYGFEIDGGTASFLTLNVDLKVALGSGDTSFRPFIVGGAGLFKMLMKDTTIRLQWQSETVAGYDETKLGISMGAGFDVILNQQMSLYLVARYTVGFTEDESTTYFPLNMGLNFR